MRAGSGTELQQELCWVLGKSKRHRQAGGEIVATAFGADELSLQWASAFIARDLQEVEKTRDTVGDLGRLLEI